MKQKETRVVRNRPKQLDHPSALGGGYHLAWIVGAAVVVTSIVLTATLLKSEGAVATEDRLGEGAAAAWHDETSSRVENYEEGALATVIADIGANLTGTRRPVLALSGEGQG